MAVSDDVRALSRLSDPDYTYACELRTSTAGRSAERLAEQWARAIMEDAPRPLRWFIVAGWRVGLGLRLAPGSSAAHIAGWDIASTSPGAVVMAADSFLLRANLIVRVDDDDVVHATFVQFERRPARVVWAVAAPIHQVIIPYLLRRAADADR